MQNFLIPCDSWQKIVGSIERRWRRISRQIKLQRIEVQSKLVFRGTFQTWTRLTRAHVLCSSCSVRHWMQDAFVMVMVYSSCSDRDLHSISKKTFSPRPLLPKYSFCLFHWTCWWVRWWWLLFSLCVLFLSTEIQTLTSNWNYMHDRQTRKRRQNSKKSLP